MEKVIKEDFTMKHYELMLKHGSGWSTFDSDLGKKMTIGEYIEDLKNQGDESAIRELMEADGIEIRER